MGEGARQLAAAGIPDGAHDVRLLAAHLLGVDLTELARLEVLGHDAPPRLAELVRARAERVPVQHLTGRAGFRRLELAVGPGVFVPRPETELLVDLVLAELAGAAGPASTVVDLCTGSGAIALAVADELPRARVVALELDPDALAWARANVDRLGLAERVQLRRGDVRDCPRTALADLRGEVDVVVANPPYIPTGSVPVDPEVRDHDPRVALYGGGPDGLDLPRAVLGAAAGLLRLGGLLVMEHADVQGPGTRRLAGAGWTQVRTVPDLTGRDRVLTARRAGQGAADRVAGGGRLHR